MNRTDSQAVIEASQGQSYGKYEFDLRDLRTGEYCGLLLGTETRQGVIWEIQEWRQGNPTGSLMRIPATNLLDALVNARIFLIR